MALLEFKEVKKRFGKHTVLDGVTFKIREGEIFGLVGKSGCGKSTLFRILMGMLPADSGSVFFGEKKVWSKLNYLRKNTGFASQGNTLFYELSVEENAIFFGELYGVKRRVLRGRFDELVKLLGLEDYIVILKRRGDIMVREGDIYNIDRDDGAEILWRTGGDLDFVMIQGYRSGYLPSGESTTFLRNPVDLDNPVVQEFLNMYPSVSL
jgi:ABC-type sugar transport system ATPase subunit